MNPTRRITADAAVAIQNPRAIAGRIQSSMRAYGPVPCAATIAAVRYSRPATTMTWSNTTFQTTIAHAIQSACATRGDPITPTMAHP